MPDHEFDNALGNKVRALMLEPSPAVWDAVAARLREKKRRRALLWWMSAAAVLTISLGYWAMESNSSTVKPHLPGSYSANTPAGTDTAFKSLSDPGGKPNAAPMPSAGSLTDVPAGASSGKTIASGKALPQETTLQQLAGKTTSSVPKEKTTFKTSNKTSLQQPGNFIVTPNGKNKFLIASNYSRTSKGNIKPTVTATGSVRDLNAYLAFSLTNFDKGINLQQPSAKKGQQQLVAAAAPQKISRSRYRRWEYAFDVKGGMSSVQSGLFESFKSSTFEYQAANAAPTFTNNAFDNTLRFVQRQPSSVKAGPSVQAQLQVSRALSKKWRLGAGVQYMYQSSQVKFGAVVDSSAALVGNPLYLAARAPSGGIKTNDFSNQYHSVLVPVELSWNFDNKQHWYLNSGFSAGLLVGLDAFQYNAQSGYFYRDDKSFTRFQAGVFTGVYYKVNPSGKWQFSVGPSVQYQLNGLDKRTDARRMLFVGLGARIHFRPGGR